MENLQAAFKTYESYKELVESNKAALDKFERERPVIVAKTQLQPDVA